MASATWRQAARRLALLPAVAVACLLAGCQAGGSPVAVASASPPSGVVVPPAAPPISVTVAPASVAPGAVHVGTRMPAVATALSLPSPARYVAPCPSYPLPKQIPVHVSPGSGSALVSWVSDGDGTVRSYRVSAISQRLVAGAQPAAPSITTARGVGCGPRGVSFSGLRHGTAYVFWVEEGSPDPAGGLRFWMVGQSTGVLVP
jgi:hypothetical protein